MQDLENDGVQRVAKWKNGCMASLPTFVVLALVAVFGVAVCTFVWLRRRRRVEPSSSGAVALVRRPMRSQVIVLSPHETPTREFAAHMEELASLSMRATPTRAISSNTNPLRSRREEDETLKVDRGAANATNDLTPEDLVRLLGPAPTPDLSNIEIYYRLGLAYLALSLDAQARRCFSTVEEISPGYRDAAVHLSQLPMLAPATNERTAPHHVVTVSGCVPARPDRALTEVELKLKQLSRRNGG